MNFTSLHRAVGAGPQRLTDELLDEAVATGVAETHDLDWKSQLPPMKGLTQTDFPKDIAAMANNGGGLIIYGVTEIQKAASGRVDIGTFDEGYERALRSAAITAITPPVFGLKVHRLGTEAAQNRAVIVEIAAGVDGPHLIYRNDLFGAPIRNDSDTVWMKERQIEAMYRARFDERRRASDALNTLVVDAAAGRNTGDKAWFIAVAHPRVPRIGKRTDRDEARAIMKKVNQVSLTFSGPEGVHPFQNVDPFNPRPGLRRWTAVNTATRKGELWKEAWASIHHDGSVTLVAALGGHRRSMDGHFDGHQVEARGIECAVADFMALLRVTAESTANDEYDARVGIEWAGAEPLQILTMDNMGSIYDGASIPLHRFVPVEISLNARGSDSTFKRYVYDLARDCINQGGISNLQLIGHPV